MPARKSTAAAPAAFDVSASDIPPTGDEAVVGKAFLGKVDVMAGMTSAVEDVVSGKGVWEAQEDPDKWVQQSPMTAATPKARPGMVQQWIRIADVNGIPDVGNKEDAFRNRGWRPRPGDTLSEHDASPVFEAPGFTGGVIVWKGQLLLCEMPQEQHDKLTRRLSSQADAVNAVIYNEAAKNNDLPSKYASMNVEGSDAADLMD